MNKTYVAAALAAGFTFAASAALAQPAYPAKSIRVVVPFPPGGTNDLVARLVAADLSKTIGQTLVIDNRGGASGVIGAENVAKSAPDGYTVMVHSTSHLTNAYSYNKLPYDTFRDFEPIGMLAAQPYVLVVHPALPVRSVKEFIALTKARPDQLTYGSNGEGGAPHVFMSLFANMAGVKVIHVPYKGGGPMATSLIAGETQSAMATIGSILPMIKANRLRTIAVPSSKRSTILPDVPTIAEAGLAGYSMDAWVGAFAPAKTPKAIVDRLHDEFNRVLKKPEFAKQMAEQGVEPWVATQTEFVAQMKSDYEKYGKVFKIIGTPKN
jgi:tripartite-type tricarboxylate transporter receptor subunit TctC